MGLRREVHLPSRGVQSGASAPTHVASPAHLSGCGLSFQLESLARTGLRGSSSSLRPHPVGAASPRAAPMPEREFDSASWCGPLPAGMSPAPSAGVPALQTLYHGALLALTTIVSSARLPSPWAHVSPRSASSWHIYARDLGAEHAG